MRRQEGAVAGVSYRAGSVLARPTQPAAVHGRGRPVGGTERIGEELMKKKKRNDFFVLFFFFFNLLSFPSFSVFFFFYCFLFFPLFRIGFSGLTVATPKVQVCGTSTRSDEIKYSSRSVRTRRT